MVEDSEFLLDETKNLGEGIPGCWKQLRNQEEEIPGWWRGNQGFRILLDESKNSGKGNP